MCKKCKTHQDQINVLDDCLKRANITEKEPSMEHFVQAIQAACNEVNIGYYSAMSEAQTAAALNKVIRIARAAKKFNLHFGF